MNSGMVNKTVLVVLEDDVLLSSSSLLLLASVTELLSSPASLLFHGSEGVAFSSSEEDGAANSSPLCRRYLLDVVFAAWDVSSAVLPISGVNDIVVAVGEDVLACKEKDSQQDPPSRTRISSQKEDHCCQDCRERIIVFILLLSL